MRLKEFSEILEIARKRNSRKLVVAAAEDLYVLQAVLQARAKNIIEPVLVGDTFKILEICAENQLDLEDIPLIEEKNPEKACILAIDLIRNGEADILMKGLVSTAPLLKGVLDKKRGLRKSDVLSHAALFEIPSYHKLLPITDAGMNVDPGIAEKISIIENAVEIFHRLGIPDPKVAVLGPIETINTRILSTVDAGEIKRMNASGKIKGCIIDGPLALDIAVSKEAARHKKINSPVAGDADILLTPDLNSGNILFKCLIFLGRSTSASIVMGDSVPIVLTSRADYERSKFMSIALAAALY